MSFVIAASSLKSPQDLQIRQDSAPLAPPMAVPVLQPQIPVTPQLQITTPTLPNAPTGNALADLGSIPAPTAPPPGLQDSPTSPILPIPAFQAWTADQTMPTADNDGGARNAPQPQAGPAQAAPGPADVQPPTGPGASISPVGTGVLSTLGAPNAVHAAASPSILDAEQRTNAVGQPVVYHPPADDRGGGEEIAGFTVKDNPQELALIKATPLSQRRNVILGLIDKETAPAAQWTSNPGVESLMRDTIHHRGLGGAQAIASMAAGAQPSYSTTITPQTIKALGAMKPADAIDAITKARQAYEQTFYGNRPDLANGLQNRFTNSRQAALNLLTQS